MLYIVLVLVLAAFGLLIAALTTANTLWAWISVAVSVVAAGLLIMDWLGGRRERATDVRGSQQVAPPPVRVERVDPVRIEQPDVEEDIEEDIEEDTAGDAGEFEGEAAAEPVFTESAAPIEDELGEPAEEPTDASDLLVVAGLSVEVRVVDEHPRYHLANCTWLADKGTIPIAVSEARQLGFTPCARCGPDAVLAAKHRAER